MNTDNINITKKQLEQLADMIVEKLIIHKRNEEIRMQQEEELLGELARLQTMLHIYEDNEEYMKASIIKNKLDKLNKKLDNLNIKFDDKD